MMSQLRNGLDAPLSGMATAFSSSLFGLAGSLALGFLDLQLGQAMGRFFNELEDWLSAFAKFNEGGAKTESVSSGALASGMSEEAARALLSLSHSIAAGEETRAQTLAQMSATNTALARRQASLHHAISSVAAQSIACDEIMLTAGPVHRGPHSTGTPAPASEAVRVGPCQVRRPRRGTTSPSRPMPPWGPCRMHCPSQSPPLAVSAVAAAPPPVAAAGPAAAAGAAAANRTDTERTERRTKCAGGGAALFRSRSDNHSPYAIPYDT